MKNAVIKVIKKQPGAVVSPEVRPEKSSKVFSKKTVHSIEDNIRNWIDELQVRKNDELIQTHMFLNRA
jgi:hypothetical protein